MSRELYLHIGTTKTGSTAIQNTLSQRRRELEQLGVYLQNRPAKASHSLLAASVLDDLGVAPRRGHPMWSGIDPRTRLERFKREFKLEMETLPDWARCCIISSEHLSNWLQRDDEVDRLAAALRPYFDKITVVVYLRRQDQHVSSGYNEILKSGVVPDADLPQSAEVIRGLDYQGLLERYAKAFGQAAIKPRIFAREELLNRNVVDDFYEAVGVEFAGAEQATTNQSINLTGQELLACAIRRLGNKNPGNHLNTLPQWRVVTQAVESQCQGTGWRLSASAAQAFMSQFERSNEHVRSLYFPDRKELFSNTYADAACEEPSTQDTKFDACIDVIFRLASMHCERESQLAMSQYRLLSRLDDQPGMRDMARLALRSSPNNITARLRMADMTMADGRLIEALDHLDTVLRLDPQNKEARRKKTQWNKQRPDALSPSGQVAQRPLRQKWSS